MRSASYFVRWYGDGRCWPSANISSVKWPGYSPATATDDTWCRQPDAEPVGELDDVARCRRRWRPRWRRRRRSCRRPRPGGRDGRRCRVSRSIAAGLRPRSGWARSPTSGSTSAPPGHLRSLAASRDCDDGRTSAWIRASSRSRSRPTSSPPRNPEAPVTRYVVIRSPSDLGPRDRRPNREPVTGAWGSGESVAGRVRTPGRCERLARGGRHGRQHRTPDLALPGRREPDAVPRARTTRCSRRGRGHPSRRARSTPASGPTCVQTLADGDRRRRSCSCTPSGSRR